jgi:hypothetical protein
MSDRATFRHPADYTDLNRQFHATWPKGTSLKTIANQVGFTKTPDQMPTYSDALKIHEFMLQNGGKIPTARDLVGK